jgi:hypothetical protein
MHLHGERVTMTVRTCLRTIALVAAALLVATPSAARILYDDAPPTGSRNGRFYAEPKKGNTQVFEVLGPNKSRLVWEKPGWEYQSYLSNDGEYLVSGKYCRGSIPRGFTPDSVILEFYHRKTLLRSVRLSDLVDVKKLRHMWGICGDFLPGNRFEIFTFENYLIFDGTTGKLLEKLPSRGVPNID